MSPADTATQCPVSRTGAAFGKGYRPFEHDGMYAFFHRARAEQPVFWNEEIGYWVVTQREEVMAILRDPTRFSASVALSPVAPQPESLLTLLKDGGLKTEPTQVNCDAPKHTRIRASAGRFLNAKVFSGYEPQIREIVRGHIAGMRGKGRVNIVDSLTYEVPAKVLMRLLGVSDIDPRRIKEWGDNRLVMIFGQLSEAELLEGGRKLLDFWHYCEDLVAARMETPGDDYPSMMLALRDGDDSVLTINEIVSLMFGVLLAGHETTTNGTTNIILELLRHREAWEALCADPSRATQAVEEGLRFASPVVNWRRLALEDVEIGGVPIAKGEKILISLASANHDEAYFADPETYDLDRTNARDHCAFGYGTHFCIGAPLARLEIRIMIEELLSAFPNMALVPNQDIDWLPTISFRGPAALWVDLGE
jgi:cytochrome P450